ncbi:MAG: hypothetical protein JJU36_11130 [Phycisphaeraceae bacterium]|nr:hypothetical protein [Phycisphaeraceae bacterium]
MADDPKPRYWFVPKTWGWGWQPATWEGWVTVLIWVLVVIPLGAVIAVVDIVWFLVFMAAMVAVLLAICRYKSGPSRSG